MYLVPDKAPLNRSPNGNITLSSGVDAKTLAGILGHTKASFTLDTYTHTTGDMQKRAAKIVGGFLTDYLGEEMNPWQSRENTAAAPSV